jgi:hypothetical protein
MPNGLSAYFVVKRTELTQLIEVLDDDTIVSDATFLEGHESRNVKMTASELKEVIRDFDPTKSHAPTHGDDVVVTEQDRAYYILHLQPWVSIGKESALFEGMERLKAEWNMRLLKKLQGE